MHSRKSSRLMRRFPAAGIGRALVPQDQFSVCNFLPNGPELRFSDLGIEKHVPVLYPKANSAELY